MACGRLSAAALLTLDISLAPLVLIVISTATASFMAVLANSRVVIGSNPHAANVNQAFPLSHMMYGRNSAGQSVHLLNDAPPVSFSLALHPKCPSIRPRSNALSGQASAVTSPTKPILYRCPVAQRYGCIQSFTTSGHATRHAKMHCGKKDVVCPECDKSFTRKDNMEQHRLTHLRLKHRRVRRHNHKVAKPLRVEEISDEERKIREDSVFGSLLLAIAHTEKMPRTC
ncbi:hypothetical protein MBLNU459_g5252t1 [Dothideomycetes sp. NU459]